MNVIVFISFNGDGLMYLEIAKALSGYKNLPRV